MIIYNVEYDFQKYMMDKRSKIYKISTISISRSNEYVYLKARKGIYRTKFRKHQINANYV